MSTMEEFTTVSMITVTGSVDRVWPPPIGGIVALTITMVIGIVGNTIIIITFLRKPLRVPYNMFYINLAIADLNMHLFLVHGLVSVIIHQGAMGFGEKTCLGQGITLCLNALGSFYSIGCIAISRYIIIVVPQKKKYMTWVSCTVVCVACWILPVLLASPIFTGWARMVWQPRQYFCAIDFRYNMAFNGIIFVFGFGAVSAVMFFCYFRIYMVYRNSRKRVAVKGANDNKGLDKEFRLALQLFIVYAIYNLCWLPYYIVAVFLDMEDIGPTWVFVMILFLGSCNSAVNIFVYLKYNQTFRSECKKLFGIGEKSNDVGTSLNTKSTKSTAA